jgi:hypothetical protein
MYNGSAPIILYFRQQLMRDMRELFENISDAWASWDRIVPAVSCARSGGIGRVKHGLHSRIHETSFESVYKVVRD